VLTPSLSTSSSSGLRFAISPEPTALSTVLPATSPRFANLPLGSRIEVAQDSWKMARRCGELIGAGSGGGAGLLVDYGGDRAFGDSFRVSRR
jgi:NADH dehydrogenase [ubiquinone] 1 alpha subcomplex assembly factor 7